MTGGRKAHRIACTLTWYEHHLPVQKAMAYNLMYVVKKNHSQQKLWLIVLSYKRYANNFNLRYRGPFLCFILQYVVVCGVGVGAVLFHTWCYFVSYIPDQGQLGRHCVATGANRRVVVTALPGRCLVTTVSSEVRQSHDISLYRKC